MKYPCPECGRESATSDAKRINCPLCTPCLNHVKPSEDLDRLERHQFLEEG